jgi:hypothetical protein
LASRATTEWEDFVPTKKKDTTPPLEGGDRG